MDLHVHTPASQDYQDKDATTEQIVDRAIAQGLAAIAITDHQTAAGVDSIRIAGAAKGLIVFPAVELMTAGGERGIHINILFDVDKTTEHVHQFLNRVKVYTKDGTPTIISELTVGQVADELAAYDPTALIVLAHCHSSKGATGDIKGEQRGQIFQRHRRNILGAEASEKNFRDEDRRKNRQRVVDVFDGSDSNFQHRTLGVFQASDAHTVGDIGRAYSWFKVDEPITIEDIRQCCIDRDTRIRQPHEFTPIPCPRITSLVITSGFLKDQRLEFHDGLNSILGAKGSGKSLVIEALRFVMNQSPTVSPIKEDHWAKLDKQVKAHGKVRAECIDESGKTYRITRTYQPTDGHPTDIIDVSDGSKKVFTIPEVFPVLFLSQNEIIRIAEDPTGSSLRTFIDRFFDFHHHQRKIEVLVDELRVTDRRVAESLRAHLSLTEAKQKAATFKEEIARLNRQLTNTTFDKYTKSEGIGLSIKAHIDFVDDLDSELVALGESFDERETPPLEAATGDTEPGIQRAADAATRALMSVREHIAQARSEVADQRALAADEHKLWEEQFAPIKTDYERLVKDAGGNQIALDQRRRRVVADLASIEKQITGSATKAQGLRVAAIARNGILDRLDVAYREYFDERRKRCEYFTTQSNGSIVVTIAQGRDSSQFKAQLLGVKRGTYLKEDAVDQVVAAITPRALVGAAFSFEYGGRQETKTIEELSKSSGISDPDPIRWTG